jgi:hypothetical protein
MATHYETTEITLEDYGEEASTLFLAVDYLITDYWPGNYEQPPEGGELEIEQVKVMGALVGPDLQATPEQCAAFEKAINRDGKALARIEEMVSAEIEM